MQWLVQRPALALGGLLFVLTLAAFLPAVGHPFTIYDDGPYVLDNEDVKHGLTLAGVGHACTGSVMYLWSPVTVLSLMVDGALFGQKPAGFHFVNVLFHAGSAVLLFTVLLQLTRAGKPSIESVDAPPGGDWSANVWRSAMVAATFAIHPLRVESVAWVAERKDVLSLFFGLAAIGFYVSFIRRGGAWRYIGSCIWLALSLMSKPMFVTLPALLLLLDYWPLGRFDPAEKDKPTWRRRFIRAARLVTEKIPMLAMALAVYWIVKHVGDRDSAGRAFLPVDMTLLRKNAIVSYVLYMVKMVRFDRLAFFYPMPSAISNFTVAACGLLLIGMTATVTLLAWNRRAYRYLAVGWLWFLVSLLPVIGVFGPVGMHAMADRYSYLPSIGLLIMVFGSMPDAIWTCASARPLTVAASVLLVGVLFAFTRIQLSYWKDDVTLFRHAIAVTHDNAPAELNLGYYAAKAGNWVEAEARYRTAAQIDPGNADAWCTLGEICRRNPTRYSEAEEAYRHAISDDPLAPGPHRGLARIAAARGQTDIAIREYELSLRQDRDPSTELALARLRGQMLVGVAGESRPVDAAAQVKVDQANEWVNRGMDLAEQGRLDEAIADYRQALAVMPDNADAHLNLGSALLRMGKFEESASESAAALRADPRSPAALYNAGAAAFRLGRRQPGCDRLLHARVGHYTR